MSILVLLFSATYFRQIKRPPLWSGLLVVRSFSALNQSNLFAAYGRALQQQQLFGHQEVIAYRHAVYTPEIARQNPASAISVSLRSLADSWLVSHSRRPALAATSLSAQSHFAANSQHQGRMPSFLPHAHPGNVSSRVRMNPLRPSSTPRIAMSSLAEAGAKARVSGVAVASVASAIASAAAAPFG